MKAHLLKINDIRIKYVVWVLMCCGLNILSLSICTLIKSSIYIDTVGTILMSFVWGGLPGLVVAVLSNIIFGFFMPDSLCYTLLGVFVALRAAVYIGEEKRDYKKTFCFIADTSLICGILGTCIQWFLIGEPQLDYVNLTARKMAGSDFKLYILYSAVLIISLSLLDKIIAFSVAYGLYKIVPPKSREKMWNSRWKQTPIPAKEKKEIVQAVKKGTPSLMVKAVVLLMLVAVLSAIVLGVVSSRVNYDENKSRGRSMATDVVRFVGNNIESKYLESFAVSEKRVLEFKEVKYMQYNAMLQSLIESIPLIKRLSVYGVQDGCIYVLFNTDEEFQKDGYVGQELGEEEAKTLSPLLSGEKENVIEEMSKSGYDITAFERVQVNRGDNMDFYVSAEVAIENYGSFLHSYAVKMLLVFSGFFALILVSGFWMAAHHLVYPISALEKRIDEFMESIEDQDKLYESVRDLEKLDIRTKDELERLYNSICQMANTTAEQMRSIMVLARSNEKMQSGLVATMADIVESQNIDSKAHIQKTSAYVRIILEGLKKKGYYTEKLTLKYMRDVEMSTPLYDIGKIKIPDNILNKPDALTDEEFEIMKTHTTEGRKILENAISSVKGENYLKEARNMAAYHHEHWDGTGYPEGLHGEVIPLSARVMAIADVFDAVTSLRVYKSASPYDDALDVILDGSGTRFDPKCVEAFVDSFSEVKNVLRQYS